MVAKTQTTLVLVMTESSLSESNFNYSKCQKDKNKSKVKKENTLQDEFSKKMDEMFKECKYSLKYHFPKKIKRFH